MIKIDIISGFLGSGKTTFIKKMLSTFIPSHEKVVIIENEFGKIGIDGDIIRKEGFQVYELTNGCICCSLKSDFEFTLKEIIEKVKPDRIIFEPSGIFVLDEVLELLSLPAFSSKCHINYLITIIDSLNYLKQSKQYGYFFNSQIANAGMLILSKSQWMKEAEITEIVTSLQEVNPTAEIRTKNWEDLTTSDIVDVPNQWLQYLTKKHIKSHDDGETFTPHPHFTPRHGFESVGFEVKQPLSKKVLESILKGFSDKTNGEVLRGKGLIPSENGALEFNYVNEDFTIMEKSAEPSYNINFIGIKLNKAKIRELFNPHEAF